MKKKKNTLTQKMMEINHEKIIIKMHSEIIKKDFFFKTQQAPTLQEKWYILDIKTIFCKDLIFFVY